MTRIIIDSTIDLPEQYRRQVHIVPLTIHFGTEELLDGVDIDRQRFRPAVRSGGGRRGQRRGADHLPQAVRHLSERLYRR